MSFTGRVWTTSASSDPSVTTRFTPSASAASSTVVQKARQRNEGSAPATSTRSHGASAGRAARISTSGQTIGALPPEVRLTSGRVAWKS